MRLLPAVLRRELPPEPVPPPAEVGLEPLQPRISAFWQTTYGATWSPQLTERVWVANRCLQLCSQQIASMPLRFFGARDEPAWIANPDPVWFPNGIGDAVFAATWSMLAWGDAFLYITSRYADGYPSGWTVLDPAGVSVRVEGGRRVYRSGQSDLRAGDVVQVSRDPRGRATGTSALAAYGSQLTGIAAVSAAGQSIVDGGGIPNAVLKSTRKLTAEQAQAIQNQWVNARARAPIGAPAVLPPEISFEQLAFNATDLALLELQEFNARAIASAFSIPSFMLNMPLEGGLTYQNPETLFEVWWRSELRPAAHRVQRALSANMLPRGSWVEFDARAALAPTSKGQAETWKILYEMGVVTRDEVRAAMLHLPPLTEGEALDELSEPPTAAASPAQAPIQTLRPVGVA